MGRGLNKVLLIGNLGRDPEMKYMPSGNPFTTFSLAVSRNWRTPEGESREETEWFNIVAWQKLAETCNEYLRKGSKVYIEGRLQTREYQGQDGQMRKSVEVVASEMVMLDNKQTGPMGGGSYGGGGGADERPARSGPVSSGASRGGSAAGDFDDTDADADADDIPF
jgi:single-strand DNA-binding protein